MPEIGLLRYPYSLQLGWSNTRSETFRGCRRRYFYQYYWEFERELPLDRILLLRQLSSAPMIISQAVHTVLAAVLKRLLKTGDPIDQSHFHGYVSKAIQGELQSCSGLMGVYYGEREPVAAADLLPVVLVCMESFPASDRCSGLHEQLAEDQPFLIEPPGYGEARLEELKIYAKVDALLQTPTETVILDWKSGRQDPLKHLRKLVDYAAWADSVDLELMPSLRLEQFWARAQPNFDCISQTTVPRQDKDQDGIPALPESRRTADHPLCAPSPLQDQRKQRTMP
jgi:hypothetical protein